MDLSSSLKPSTLLALSYSEVSAHFQKLLGQSPPVSHVESINDLLVHRIHSHALPPAIYDIWLPLALRHVPSLLVRALCDKTSAAVRESAIKRVARLFRGSKWKSNGWDALGGAEGIAGIFKQMSAADVRLLSKAIARCRFAKSPSPLTVCVDSLIESMNEDNSRPFFNTLSPLYPLCRPGFHKDLVANLPNAPSTDHLLARLGQVNPSLMREVVIGTAIAPLHVRVSILRSCRRAMVDSPESYYAESRAWSRSEFPPGMNFCLDLCHTMAAHPSLRSALGNDIGLYVQDTLRLAARKNLLFSCIELFFAQLIQLPSYIWPEGSLRTTLTRELASCWSISFYGSAGPNARFCMKSIAHRDHPSHPGPAHQISLERDLCSLLRRYQDPHLARSKHCPWFVDTLTEILCQIAPAGRGPFLVHLCRLSDSLCYGSGYEQFSLDSSVNPPGDREKQVIPVWAYEIMDLLPAQTGQILFDRMLIIHGCADFIPDDVSSHYGLSYERQCQLKAKWEAEMGGEVTIGRQLFHELQKRAEGQRDSGKRSDSAIAAIDVANATHSLEVWRLAVQWSKRFLRDTMVFADIMSQALLDPEMLSCTEMPTSRLPSSLVELRSAVDSTNEILHTLRDILVLSLREPIDQSFIKAELPTFWSKLVSNRVRGIKRFFRAGLGTESELVDNLLTPLIPELVTWERVALKENMSWNFDCGDEPRPLREFSFQENRPPPVAVLHFLDELARQRDALFQDHRKSWWPKHEEVGKGFPRGLAVQQLLPTWECFGFALQNRGHAPYITGRIMDVLEANPETVLAPVPSDDDIVNAYIDSMSFVIRAHLSLFPSKKAKNEALIRLWEKYAARQEEYGEYFPVLQTLMLSGIAEPLALYSAARVIRPPRLPQPSYLWMERESDEILEWDPAGEACNKNLPARDDRSLPETLLYLRLVGDYCDRYNYIVPEARSLDVLHDPHWPWPNIRYSPLNRELVRKMSPASRDAVIMSALLYLDSIATYTPNRLLTTSFPSSDSQRAPPMRLAAEFTKTAQENNGGKGMKRALWVLGSSIKSVPASLLRDLTITYLDCLQALQKIDPMFAPLMRATFKLIRLLVQSDVPELAVDVVCRVIETYPDESTYYRHMKLLTLGRRLHPEAAATFMDCFAGFVCSKLVEQKQAKPASQPEGQAFVKITTVKFLAETLGEADFLPTDTILQIFTRLVNSSHHVDIRAAVAKSTLGLLTRVGGTAFDNVYGFLSSLADTAAGPSEKDPVPGREAWKTSLPTVSPSTNRPTLSLLLKNAFEAIPPGRREKYASEILIPLIESSRDQHTYWMDIFLSSIGLSRNDPDIQIPNFGPFDPRISDTVFRIWGTYLPPNFLTEHHRNWALTPIHHHAAYQHITNTLETKNPGYRQTNSGTHWNEIATLVKSTNPLTSLDLLLFSSKGPEIENGITLSIVAREFKYRLGLLARNPIQYYRKLDKFVVSISPVIRALRGVRGYRAGSDNMNEADRAKRYNELDWILRWVVDDIQCLDGSGPPILPSQLEMQALLLPSPAYLKPVGDKLELFVSEVTRLLRRWIEDPVLVLEFDVVVRIVQEVRKEDAIVVADMLAGEQVDLESIREIEFCLRVRLAKGLLDRVGDSDLRLSALVRSIVGRWRESQNQFVKRTGWEVLI